MESTAGRWKNTGTATEMFVLRSIESDDRRFSYDRIRHIQNVYCSKHIGYSSMAIPQNTVIICCRFLILMRYINHHSDIMLLQVSFERHHTDIMDAADSIGALYFWIYVFLGAKISQMISNKFIHLYINATKIVIINQAFLIFRRCRRWFAKNMFWCSSVWWQRWLLHIRPRTRWAGTHLRVL